MKPERLSFPRVVGKMTTVRKSEAPFRPLPIDEMNDSNGAIRSHCVPLKDWLDAIPPTQFEEKRKEAERLFRRLGITFAVYGDSAGTERLIPFDLVPRMIPAKDWQVLAAGLRQRISAL